MRFTEAVKTRVGKLDVNNPLLMLTLPKDLRKKEELVKTIKENAEELQTHFDTRATLLDILKVGVSTLCDKNGFSTSHHSISNPGPRWTSPASWATPS